MLCHPCKLITLILCHSALRGSTAGEGLCLRQSVKDNPSAQHCLLNSGRILGIEGSSHLLTWASLLQSLRALHLLPSLKNQSVSKHLRCAVLTCRDCWPWVTSLLSKRSWLCPSSQSPDPCPVLFSPLFACSSQTAPLRIDLKNVLGGGNSWGHVLISGCKSHVP